MNGALVIAPSEPAPVVDGDFPVRLAMKSMNNSGSKLENPGGELRCHLAVDQGFLDRAAALARGDRFSVDEIARGAFDIGVFVYVEEVDAGDLFHHALA